MAYYYWQGQPQRQVCGSTSTEKTPTPTQVLPLHRSVILSWCGARASAWAVWPVGGGHCCTSAPARTLPAAACLRHATLKAHTDRPADGRLARPLVRRQARACLGSAGVRRGGPAEEAVEAEPAAVSQERRTGDARMHACARAVRRCKLTRRPLVSVVGGVPTCCAACLPACLHAPCLIACTYVPAWSGLPPARHCDHSIHKPRAATCITHSTFFISIMQVFNTSS